MKSTKEGDVYEYPNLKIEVIDTPGVTDASISYKIVLNGKIYIICGDIIYGDVKLLDLYSLQKGFKNIFESFSYYIIYNYDN